jgi:hypothetical protein
MRVCLFVCLFPGSLLPLVFLISAAFLTPATPEAAAGVLSSVPAPRLFYRVHSCGSPGFPELARARGRVAVLPSRWAVPWRFVGSGMAL